MLPYGYNPIFLAKYQEATMKHMKLTFYGTGHFTTFAFTSPDKPCNLLSGDKKTTIRHLLLHMKARKTERPLFLALNAATKPQEKGGFVITYCKAYEDKAVEKIANITAYFKHYYGEDSLERFTPEACDAADKTKWDVENDRPITVMEQDLDDVMDEEIEWLENLGDVSFGTQKTTEVILECPKAPKRSALPSSADDDTVGTFFPGQTAATGSNDDECDDLTTDTPANPTQANDEARAAHPPSEATSVAESSSEDSAGGV
jgi:hypothetical protein